MKFTAGQCEAALQVANDLIRRGIPKDEAVRRACLAAAKISRKRFGMGQEEPKLVLSSEEGPSGIVAEVRSKVSPWLWVLSIAGFGLTVINSRRITKMFGDWRRRKRA